jgi:uncharacterized delta-60 repeat protein
LRKEAHMRSFDLAFRSGLALLLSLAAATSNASDGDLDPAFGANGVAHTGLTNTQAYATAIRPDGRVVVCGFYTDQTQPLWVEEFFVAQYLPDGSLDSAFGNDGIAYVDFSAYEDTCTSLTIQPDGRIVAAGYRHSAVPLWRLDRPFGKARTERHTDSTSARPGSPGCLWWRHCSHRAASRRKDHPGRFRLRR